MTNSLKDICDSLRVEIKSKTEELAILEHNCEHKYIEMDKIATCSICGYIEWNIWYCPSSPNGVCLYDVGDGCTNDLCHYCGLPSHRT